MAAEPEPDESSLKAEPIKTKTQTTQPTERLADYFAVVGLPDELKPLDNGYDCIRMIEQVEIVVFER